MTLTLRSPTIQPNANAGPAVRALGAPRTTTTATIGIGLRATAIAEGSRSPMASFSTVAHSLCLRGLSASRGATTIGAATQARCRSEADGVGPRPAAGGGSVVGRTGLNEFDRDADSRQLESL